jgi:hypothetical protein
VSILTELARGRLSLTEGLRPLLPLQKATPKPRSKRVKPLLIRKC